MTHLTYTQRKALRRLSRGQTITRTQQADPLIQECIDTTHYITPPNLDTIPYPQSMFAWCDWEEKARAHNRPRLNQHGHELLNQLDRPVKEERQ